MVLTGKEIAAEGIVYNYDGEKAIQQQGIDVRIDKVTKIAIFGSAMWPGIICKDRSQLPLVDAELKNVKSHMSIVRDISRPADGVKNDMFHLEPGYYEIELMEGVDVPNNRVLHFKTRSSLVRCGAIVHSGQFDAGFNTEKAGCFLHVILPISIERGARIAQAVVWESHPVDEEDTYDGQFQNDKQRE